MDNTAARAALMEEWNKLPDEYAALGSSEAFISIFDTEGDHQKLYDRFKLTDKERLFLEKVESLLLQVLDVTTTAERHELAPVLAMLRPLKRRDHMERLHGSKFNRGQCGAVKALKSSQRRAIEKQENPFVQYAEKRVAVAEDWNPTVDGLVHVRLYVRHNGTGMVSVRGGDDTRMVFDETAEEARRVFDRVNHLVTFADLLSWKFYFDQRLVWCMDATGYIIGFLIGWLLCEFFKKES